MFKSGECTGGNVRVNLCSIEANDSEREREKGHEAGYNPGKGKGSSEAAMVKKHDCCKNL